MNWFRLFIRGEGFPLKMDGEPTLMGFYTTRWVEAADQEEAKSVVLSALRTEPPLMDVPQGCGAKITWEEIGPVGECDVPKIQGGFTFFAADN